jgi:transcriptional regulator of acetoin/glycerol metabolism
VADLRQPIVQSWQRSFAAGVDPVRCPALIEVEEAEANELWQEHPLWALAPPLEEQLRTVAADSKHLVVVSDAAGLLLSVL